MPVMSYIDAINLAMKEEMERDDRVFVLGEDVGRKGGVFKATTGFMSNLAKNAYLDTPLAESAIAGVAIGAAMYGMRPIAEMQFADFIMPAVNQIVSEAAKIRYRSNNDWSLSTRCPCSVWRRDSRCALSFTIGRSDVCWNAWLKNCHSIYTL